MASLPALPEVTSAEPIEAYAASASQTTCDHTEKPGVKAFRAFVLEHRGGSDLGIVRACDVGGASDHKEGRAWDWAMRAEHAGMKEGADSLIAWLLAPGEDGEPHAVFRRAGLTYIIWNERIWSVRTKSWQPYTGADPHATHVHFSFGWPGARGETSFYRWLGLPRPAPGPVPPGTPEPPKAWPVVLAAVGGALVGFGGVAIFQERKRFARRR